jgi:hypothetical protein
MPKQTTFANDFLALVFNGTAIADIAENDTTAPLGNLYVSMHTANPGVGGNQSTNEAAYTNYARVAIPRTAGGWTVAAASAINAALAQFPLCGVTGANITHVGIGTAATGAGKLLYLGALTSALAVANNIQPQFNAGALQVTEA